jgi:hypothetical protein
MFLGRLAVVQLTEATGLERATWELVEPLGYQSPTLAVTVTAPAGFITDFASVPRIPIAYELAGDLAEDCATIHDFCYATGCVSRETADLLLREMMGERGFGWLRRWSIYAAVRAFGGSHYVEPKDPPSEVPAHQEAPPGSVT